MGSSLTMGCSSLFDVCDCGSCEGGVKGDEGWFVGQRKFVGHEKKNCFRIIVVCMKYKCQRGLMIQGCCMKILDY